MIKIKTEKFNNGFTQIENKIVCDKDLSSKALGIYIKIKRFVTINGFSVKKNHIMSFCKEGKKAFDSGWDELKNKGYLKIHIHASTGNRWICKIDLLDHPNNSPHTLYHDIRGNVTTERKIDESNLAIISCQKGTFQKGAFRNGEFQKGGNNNNTIYNKTINNNIISINQSDMEMSYEDLIAKNINLNDLRIIYPNEDLVNGIYNLILEVLQSKSETIKINGELLDANFVKQRFLSLTHEHVEYVIECVNGVDKKINNMRSYLLTSIFNSPTTMKTYYSNMIKSDMMNKVLKSN